MSAAERPRIALIGCGGTISSLAADPFDYIDYPETGKKLTASEVLERIPALAERADIVPIPFREIGSSAIGPADWLRLLDTITRAASDDPGLSGFVILHGTATLEETAYFLDLTLKCEQTVVLTAAQRPLNTVGSDAAANALAALRTATDPASQGRGVLVVLNDEIHAPREVSKGSTYRLHAFHSGAFGPIGVIDPDRVVYTRMPERPHTSMTPFRIDPGADLPRIDVIYSCAGNDDTMVRAAVAAGAKGLVAAGFAPGMPTPVERTALVEASEQGIVVVQASRVGSGRVARRDWLRQVNWVGADDLTPQKARILLMLALTSTTDPDRVQSIFDTY